MATASNMKPSKDSAHYLRLQLLIIEGGTLVLRSMFNSCIPPLTLKAFLANNQVKLQKYKGKFIAKAQWELLYPASSVSLSETYDLSLLKCLLRVVCLNGNAAAFKTGSLVSTDLSPEADVVRIGNYRNEFAHKGNASLSKQEFETKWNDVEQVLCRLGQSIPNLRAEIANLKTTSIDPELAAKLKEKIKFMDSVDRETQINIREVGAKVEVLTAKVADIEISQHKLGNQLSEGTPRFETLRRCTRQQLQELNTDHIFVKTEQYSAAKKRLKEKHIVVISGHPGEGKTMMAKQLLLECSDPDRSLILSQPSDWKEVNSKRVKAIVIDDIFGVQMTSIDSQLIEKWSRFLPEIEILAKKGKLYVILTTRKTVLQESIKGYDLHRKYLFKESNIVNLYSKLAERRDILLSHMNHNRRDDSKELIDQCLKASPPSTNKGSGFAFGFPKCAEMFAAIDELFEKGAAFFAKPIDFFLDCMHNMNQNETATFLSMLLLWSNLEVENNVNCLTQYGITKKVAHKFGLDCEPDTVTKIRQFFCQDDNGFTQLDETSGKVTFNHIVISDGVGIVAGKSDLNACLHYSTKEFVMQYVTIQNTLKDSRHHVYVPPYTYDMLASKLVHILKQQEKETLANTFHDILGHAAFRTKLFVETFVGGLNDTCPEHLFTEPVGTTEDVFAFQGIILQEMPVHVAANCAIHNRTLVFKELVQQGLLKRYMGNKLANELYLSLLFAVKNQNIDLVDILINNGCDISEEALFMALTMNNQILVKKMAITVTTKLNSICTFERGNNLMCMAVQKRADKLVMLIAPFVDLSYRDDHGNSALCYAFLQQNTADAEIVFRALIENGATLDYKYGARQQTLLHLAVEFAFERNIVLLLKHNARVYIKDRSGKCPIHCAAFQGQVQIAEILLRDDPYSAGLKLTTHVHNSRVKGMTFMHVSLWKKQKHFIQCLVPIIKELLNEFNYTDHYGRTVLYCAVIDGYAVLVQQLLTISDVNKAEKNGFTPLHAAVHKGHREIARELCVAGAEVNATDKYGKTPLHVAAERNDTEMIIFLIKNGADHKMSTKRNKTALQILEQNGQKDSKSVAESILVLKECDSKYRTELEDQFIDTSSGIDTG